MGNLINKILEAKKEMEQDLEKTIVKREGESLSEYDQRVKSRQKSKSEFLRYCNSVLRSLAICLVLLLSGCYAKRIETLEKNQKVIVDAVNNLASKVIKEEQPKTKK